MKLRVMTGPSACHQLSSAPLTNIGRNSWLAMSQRQNRDRYDDTISSNHAASEIAAKQALNESSSDKVDNLFFGSSRPVVDIAILHPTPTQVFKLWQIYLDNVDPLLKITQAPTLQARLVDAANNLARVRDPNLEALMFGIYCISVLSLTQEQCQDTFEISKEDLSTRFQRGCQKALAECRFIRTTDRDCLTALFLYLLSITPQTVPRSLSVILAIAIRISQNMGMHSEAALAKHTPFEAELRRRLWWSLVLFDTRMCELASSRIRTLDPTWDCKAPLNVNDSDLRVDMRVPPIAQARCSEALFMVACCEVSEFARHTAFHINYINPSLMAFARHGSKGPDSETVELANLEQAIENRYFQFCDEDSPVHCMTMWTTRAYLAKLRLLEHQSKYSGRRQTDSQCDTATSYAVAMLASDTKIMTSYLPKRFLWLNHHLFPFLGYMQIAHGLRMRPLCGQRQRAWEVMSDNYEVWSSHLTDNRSFFLAFAKIIMVTWKTYDAAVRGTTRTVQVPSIILRMKQTLEEMTRQSSNVEASNAFFGTHMQSGEIAASIPVELHEITLEMFRGIPGPPLDSPELQQINWDIFSWSL
ncbi:Fungal specific transcription factor domain-containing protein isoform 1 [Cladophialophora immunda]|nr:Fungal specific transcription factor domain-containing protein isoform 1 [Cladophialophora immunda]